MAICFGHLTGIFFNDRDVFLLRVRLAARRVNLYVSKKGNSRLVRVVLHPLVVLLPSATGNRVVPCPCILEVGLRHLNVVFCDSHGVVLLSPYRSARLVDACRGQVPLGDFQAVALHPLGVVRVCLHRASVRVEVERVELYVGRLVRVLGQGSVVLGVGHVAPCHRRPIHVCLYQDRCERRCWWYVRCPFCRFMFVGVHFSRGYTANNT